MEVAYFFRNVKVGYSIERVFQTISDEVAKHLPVERIYLPSPRARIKDILQNGFYARRYRHYPVLHITGDVHYLLYFLPGEKTVVTVHDINYYFRLSGLKKWIWKQLYIRSLRRAAKVVFISEFARRQVEEVLPLQPDRVSVIPNPVPPGFVFSPKPFNSHTPIVLHIGTHARKNLSRTIAALQGIDVHLRIIGHLSAELLSQLVESGLKYSFAVHLTDKEILREYEQCDIVNFPSTAEGFGMPIIEGQAIGRVIITSDHSPMKEVAGEGALLVDPYSVQSIREAYCRVLSDGSLREALIEKGGINVTRFHVGQVAGEYITIYNRITSKTRMGTDA